ncbi:uncharacterized protein LOC143020834 isoform X2 [Oratosquilla oratoria]
MPQVQAMFCFIFFLISGHLKMAHAGYNPPQCPDTCECNNNKISCTGGVLPPLDVRQTSFQMCRANPPITSFNLYLAQMLQHLVTLELESVGLEDIHPKVLAVIPGLRNLSITSNNIHHLDKEIFVGCTKLENLILDNNKIKIINEDTFAYIPSLQHLSLAHNELIDIPSFLSQPVYLNFQDNQIDSLKNFKNDNLKYLNLCQNQLLQIYPNQFQARSLEEVCFGGPNFMLTGDLINKTKFPMLRKIEIIGEPTHPAMVKEKALTNLLNIGSLKIFNTENCKMDSADPILRNMGKLEKLSMKTTQIMTRNPIIPARIKFLDKITLIDFSGSPYLAYSFFHYGTGIFSGVEILNVSNCNQEHLPKPEITRRLPNLKYIDLSLNPWNCSCEWLTWIQQQHEKNALNLTNSENTTCDSPDNIKGQVLLRAAMCSTTQPPTMTSAATEVPLTTTTTEVPLTTTTTEVPVTSLSHGTLWWILAGSVVLLFLVLTIIYVTYRLYRFCHKGTFNMRNQEDGKNNMVTMHRVSVSSEFILDD